MLIGVAQNVLLRFLDRLLLPGGFLSRLLTLAALMGVRSRDGVPSGPGADVRLPDVPGDHIRLSGSVAHYLRMEHHLHVPGFPTGGKLL